MEDLKSEIIYKLMWVGHDSNVLWRIEDESEVFQEDSIYLKLAHFIDINEWKKAYQIKYKSWLENDDISIYDINNNINIIMIEALAKLNRELDNIKLYYWFDIDRTFDNEYKWTLCPISKLPLVKLIRNGRNYLISPIHPIILPD